MKKLLLIIVLTLYIHAENTTSALLEKNVHIKTINEQKKQIKKYKNEIIQTKKRILLMQEISLFLKKNQPGFAFSFNPNVKFKDEKLKNIVKKKQWYKRLKKLGLDTTYRGNNTFSKRKIDRERKTLVKYKKLVIEKEKGLYSLIHGIKPFSQKKWHITPYEVLENLCKNKNISKIDLFLSPSNNDIVPETDKTFICQNLTIDNISKLLTKDQYQSNLDYLFKDKYIFQDQEKNKYLFDDHEILISAGSMNISGLTHYITYEFITNRNITSELFLHNKEKLKSYYLLDTNNNKFYGYFALIKVSLFSKKEDSELIRIKFKELKNKLKQKYAKHMQTESYDGTEIGHYVSSTLKLQVREYFPAYYIISYSYPLYDYFENSYKELIQYLDNQKSSINDISNEL